MLLGITQWLTVFSRKYGSFFPSGFQFFWMFLLHSSQDFYKCKNKPWKRRNLQSVPSAFLITLGSCCLKSPYYLLFILLWFTCLGSFIQAVRKPWLGSVLCCPSASVLDQATPLVLSSCAQGIKLLFSYLYLASVFSANCLTQLICRYSPALLVWVSESGELVRG